MSNEATKEEIIEILKTVEDPELFLDIWFLGLIYDIRINGGEVDIDMTFTSPMCPAGPQLVAEVKGGVELLTTVDTANVHVVFDPPWEPSDEVKGMMGML